MKKRGPAVICSIGYPSIIYTYISFRIFTINQLHYRPRLNQNYRYEIAHWCSFNPCLAWIQQVCLHCFPLPALPFLKSTQINVLIHSSFIHQTTLVLNQITEAVNAIYNPSSTNEQRRLAQEVCCNSLYSNVSVFCLFQKKKENSSSSYHKIIIPVLRNNQGATSCPFIRCDARQCSQRSFRYLAPLWFGIIRTFCAI